MHGVISTKCVFIYSAHLPALCHGCTKMVHVSELTKGSVLQLSAAVLQYVYDILIKLSAATETRPANIPARTSLPCMQFASSIRRNYWFIIQNAH